MQVLPENKFGVIFDDYGNEAVVTDRQLVHAASELPEGEIIDENLLEENSELLQLKGDILHLGLLTFSKGKLIVMIPSKARKCILKELHSTHLYPEMRKNIYRSRFFWAKIGEDVEQTFLQE